MRMEYGKGPVSNERIHEVQDKLGVTLPKDFINLVRQNDGGTPEKDCYTYYDECFETEMGDFVGAFLTLSPNIYSSDLLNTNIDPPEMFPKGLIAFARNGCGDYICFDYREKKINPPIVFWNHEADPGLDDISFIAPDFATFLSMLKSDEEMETEKSN